MYVCICVCVCMLVEGVLDRVNASSHTHAVD